jgi:WD40 repeat protein
MRRTLGTSLACLAAVAVFTSPCGGAGRDEDEAPLPELVRARLGTLRFRLNLRYGSGFASLAFSPDGATLVATCDKGLGLWDAATGKATTGPGVRSLIHAAAFRPDGKTLVTFGRPAEPQRDFRKEKRLLRHWQAGTGRLLRQFEIERSVGGSATAEFPRFSPGGDFLVHTNGEEVVVWNALTGEVHGRVKETVNYWDPIALTRDGKTLAVVRPLQRTFDNEMLLYDLPAGKVRCRVLKEGCSHLAPTFTPDGKSLVTAARASLCVWDAATGKLIREIPGVRGRVAFSADGKQMACGDARHIRLYSWPAGTLVRRFEAMPGGLYVYALAFSRDGKRLVSGHDQMVAVWDVATGKRVPAAEGQEAPVCALAFSADGRWLASGGDGDGTACIWDLGRRQVHARFRGHLRAAASLAFAPDGKTLATGDGSPSYQTGGGETHIRLWDLEAGRLVRKFPAHLNGVTSLHFAPGGKTLASGGLDARVRLWNVADGARLAQVRGGDGYHWARFSHDGKRLLIADGGSGSLSLWQPDLKQKIRGLVDDPETPICAADWNRSATRALAVTSSRRGGGALTVRHWETASGKAGRSVATGGKDSTGQSCALSPDGRLLATTTMAARDEVLLWDTESGDLLARLPTGSWYITALAFSPDGGTLASGSLDTTILLWDVRQAIKRRPH